MILGFMLWAYTQLFLLLYVLCILHKQIMFGTPTCDLTSLDPIQEFQVQAALDQYIEVPF
jgi:hypothetical protein